MKVTFVHHSCFVVELDTHVLVFDYFNGDKVKEMQFEGKLPELPVDKSIYVFASHSHKDHFDLEVLDWIEKYPDIHYVFSKDIRLGKNYLERNGYSVDVKQKIKFVTYRSSYKIEDVGITTLKSTDAGVAYVVTVEGKHIYHGGDLNLWQWDGVGELINGKETMAYRTEINKLKGTPMDVAFVPLDPRLESTADAGLFYFMEHVEAEYIFPMHMWRDYSRIAEFKKKCSNGVFANRVMDICQENQVFELDFPLKH